ncbi:hypothetical protein N9T55_01250 [Flavobacteriaceae bacterium]|nr:hypothetical protein [Flavobacteriaceae bacterium]
MSRFCPTDSLAVLELGKDSEPSRFRWRLIDDCSHDRIFFDVFLLTVISG